MLRLYIFTLLLSVAFGYVSYDGHKVYRVYLDTEEKRNEFANIETKIGLMDIFGENFREKSIDVMIAPSDQNTFLSLLKSKDIVHKTQVEDLGRLIEETTPESFTSRAAADFNWTAYHTYEVISDWLDSLAEEYPTIVTNFTAGYSHLGVPIKGVRLVFNSSATRAAVIEGGVHAREWIGPAAATYMINQFLTSTDRSLRAAVDQLVWYIVPAFNPDGYNRTIYVDRMHRKNVQEVDGTNCTTSGGGNGIGTDINRNLGYNWMGGGASSNPCSVTFAGTGPFSSPEARAIRSVVESVGEELVLFLSFHSYSQLILFPYGHTTTPLDNYYEEYAIGRMAADAIENYDGTRYTVGNTAEAIYIATGSTTDWVKATYGTTLSYCFEFRDQGQYGFILPANQIIDASHEVLLAVIVLVEQIYRLDTLGTVYNQTVTTTSAPSFTTIPPIPPTTVAEDNAATFINTNILLIVLCSALLISRRN